MPELLPLPKGMERKISRLDTANAGLVFNKFIDEWFFKERALGLHDNKIRFINKFTGRQLGNAGELERQAERTKRRIEATGNPDKAQPVVMKNTSRFVTGMGLEHGLENGFTWHHTLGVPYLPGSSIKGMLRAWAEHWEGLSVLERYKKSAEDEETIKTEIIRLFGNLWGENDSSKLQMGALIVHDALPTKPVMLVAEIMTPHDGGWRAEGVTPKQGTNYPHSPGDWHSPVPIPFLAVDENNEFLFALDGTRNASSGDLEAGYELLGFALEWIGIGAKTAIGMGRFKSIEQIEMDRQGAELRRPPVVGEQVEFISGEYAGRRGKLTKTLPTADGELAQVTVPKVKGEKKIRGMHPIDILKRILPEDSDQQ